MKHENTYANLPSADDVFTVGLNHAVTLIADKKAGKGGRFGQKAVREVLKDLGDHPSEGGKIEVLNGKYGAYVTHNKVNATIPKGRDPAALTVDEAIALITERIANGGGKAKKGGGRFGGGAKKAAAPTKAKANGNGAAKAAKPAAAKKAPAKKKAKAAADAED